MAAAKAYHKAPIQLAEAVVEKVTDHSVIGEIEAVKPGFINLKINPEFLADYLSKMQNDEDLSVEKAKNPKTIIVDYGGANVAKPLHVGQSPFCDHRREHQAYGTLHGPQHDR